MTASSWLKLKSDAHQQLIEACPLLADTPMERVAAPVTIIALSGVRLTAHTAPGRLEARLSIRPAPTADQLTQRLLQRIEEVVSDRARHARPRVEVDHGSWLDDHGFAELIADLLTRGAPQDELSALAHIVARAVRTLKERIAALCEAHLEDVLNRDLPHASFLRHQLTQNAEWMLASETSGDPSRVTVLARRLQAMQIYGSLAATLRDAEITRAVDKGMPLAPLLMMRHGLTTAELRAFREARRLRHVIEQPVDFAIAVEELKAHEVPLAQWPGNGKPSQPGAWEGSVWLKAPRNHLIRPDYVGAQTDGVNDAMNALRDDLFRPLVAERLRLGGFERTRSLESFARSIELGGSGGGGIERRKLLAAIRTAVVGPRREKAFREAVALWHRRVASLSALRHERRARRPGWPELCAPWRSQCGRFEIVVLASAADLVEEGRLLDHCVGGYYDICRRGDTQILSLREDGRRVATAEVKLGSDIEAPSLEVGQFSARRNLPPAQHLYEPLRSFLRALLSGSHPTNAAKLARYRKRMQRAWDGSWHGDALPLTHARDVFPFYLPLLPRGMPDTFDAWCEQSGLDRAFDEALAHLAATPAGRSDSGSLY